MPHRLQRPAALVLLLLCLCALPAPRAAAATDPTLPLPEDWSSTLISGCETAAEFTAGRTPTHPHFEFSAYELSTTDRARLEARSLRWHFRPSTEQQTSARVAYCRSVAGPLDAISLGIKNPNGHALDLHLELLDADGVWYLGPSQPLGDERNWRHLAFQLGDFSPAPTRPDPRPGVDFPLIWIAVVAEPLVAGKPHTIYLDELRACRAPDRTAEVQEFRAPTALAPDERTTVRATVLFEQPPRAGDQLRVALTWQGATMAQAPLAFDGDLQELPAGAPHLGVARGLRVPTWLPPGRYALGLSSSTLTLAGPAAEPLAVAVAGAQPEMPAVKVDAATRPPRIKLGEDAVLPLVGGGGLADAGPRILGVPATTDYHPFGWATDVWAEPDRLDFRGLDRSAAQALAARQDALLLLQVHIASPPWWDADHPEHTQQFADGALAPPRIWGRSRTYADLTSAEWAAGARTRLRSLVEHVESAPYAHRVIGYELMAGDLGAWRPWGAELGLGQETGQAREQAFRAWLRRRYVKIDALRVAWGGPNQLIPLPGISDKTGLATWDEVTIPVLPQGRPAPTLLDPGTHGTLVDLAHFQADLPADLLLALAATAKDACKRTKLVGASYGHLLAQAASPESWRWPHLALSRLLADDTLDFLTGPLWSAAPGPTAALSAPAARARGKLYLERIPADASPGEVARTAAVALTSGAGLIAGSEALAQLPWLPAALDRVTRQAPAAGESPSDLAVVIDDLSARYLSGPGGLATPLFVTQTDHLTRSGLPWRFCMMTDLIDARVPPARMYLFLDAFRLTAEQRTALRRQVCRDRNTLLWVYAPGAIGKMLTGRAMMDLTGIRLTLVTTPGSLQVKLTEESPLLGGDLTAGLTYGLKRGSPRFFSADEGAMVFGTLVGTDFPGLVEREFEDHTSIFSAAPALPAPLLATFARLAGVPAWLGDGAPAWFGEGLLALQGGQAGSRALQLPAPATVTDLRTGETLATDAREVTVQLDEADTGLYAVSYQ